MGYLTRAMTPRTPSNSCGDSGWWPIIGGNLQRPVKSGVTVNEDTALNYSAFWCGMRILSESMAMLPCAVRKRTDERTSFDATNFWAWDLIHNSPNGEQAPFTFFEQGMRWMVGWGTCFAEKQISQLTGRTIALWPIHPSRIPDKHITRNSMQPTQQKPLEVGQPGELVFHVKNDDNTRTPIPASRILVVPGVISSNGVTGMSVVTAGAESIGMGLATEQFGATFFGNGANPGIVIKHPAHLSPDAARNLRESWQAKQGIGHANDPVILSEGGDITRLSIDPDAAQFLGTREHNIREIARWFKLPPHMLGDMAKATYANIEQQNIAYVVHALLPWIIRWQQAFNRQLLSESERRRGYYFKFNLNALLQGDSAARAAFYKEMFGMGAFSINDILELEDRNPVEGGDERFIPANNLVPLSRIDEYIDSQMQPKQPVTTPAPPDTNSGNTSNSSDNPPDLSNSMRDALAEYFHDAPGNGQDDIGERLDSLQSAIDGLWNRGITEAESVALRERDVSETLGRLRISANRMVRATLSGLLDYECRALRRAADKPEKFVKSAETFYQKFQSTMHDQLTTVLNGCSGFVEPADVSVVTSEYIALSSSQLEGLLDMPCDQFGAELNLLLANWTARPEELSNRLIPLELSHA